VYFSAQSVTGQEILTSVGWELRPQPLISSRNASAFDSADNHSLGVYNAKSKGPISQKNLKIFAGQVFIHETACQVAVMSQLTRILSRAQDGDALTTDQLLPIVYDELRRLAHRRLIHEVPGQTLQTTELVHEAYLRLVGSDQQWEGKGQFFAAAAEAMRRILVDRARKKQAAKHGGQYRRVELKEWAVGACSSSDELLVVDDLLDRLAEKHPVEAQIVKLHYFAGFNISEAGRALGIPHTTAHRHWRFARVWLYRQLSSGETPGAEGTPK